MPYIKIVFLSILFFSGPIYAGGYCAEKITSLILDGSNIHFKSSKSCINWCRVNSSWSDVQKNRIYSMLLAARTQDRTITMYWDELSSSCEKTVPTHSSPNIFYY